MLQLLTIKSLAYYFWLYFMPIQPAAEVSKAAMEFKQDNPILRIDAIITSVDTTAAYVVIKARSALDRQPLTIFSERDRIGEAVLYDLPYTIVRPGQQYRFVLEQTMVFKSSSPSEPEEYDLLNLLEFRVGNQVIVEYGEVPYVALNMCGYRIYQ